MMSEALVCDIGIDQVWADREVSAEKIYVGLYEYFESKNPIFRREALRLMAEVVVMLEKKANPSLANAFNKGR